MFVNWLERQVDVRDNALTLYQQGVPHQQSLAGSGILMHPICLRKQFDNGLRNVDLVNICALPSIFGLSDFRCANCSTVVNTLSLPPLELTVSVCTFVKHSLRRNT